MSSDTTTTITSYVTDMIALEQHIATAIAGQIKDQNDDPTTTRVIRIIHDTCEQHIVALESLAERRKQAGQGLAESVKRVASSILGAGAAAIDFLRTEKLAKNLRDDYAAVSMANIGYVMLHTTALSLGDEEVAAVAHQHLQDHAASVMSLNHLIPAVVIRQMQEEGLPARVDVLPMVASNIEAAWNTREGVASGAR